MVILPVHCELSSVLLSWQAPKHLHCMFMNACCLHEIYVSRREPSSWVSRWSRVHRTHYFHAYNPSKNVHFSFVMHWTRGRNWLFSQLSNNDKLQQLQRDIAMELKVISNTCCQNMKMPVVQNQRPNFSNIASNSWENKNGKKLLINAWMCQTSLRKIFSRLSKVSEFTINKNV